MEQESTIKIGSEDPLVGPADPVSEFERDLCKLLNRHSKENESDTPDFILANYLTGCLENYNKTTRNRMLWYGTGTSN